MVNGMYLQFHDFSKSCVCALLYIIVRHRRGRPRASFPDPPTRVPINPRYSLSIHNRGEEEEEMKFNWDLRNKTLGRHLCGWLVVRVCEDI